MIHHDPKGNTPRVFGSQERLHEGDHKSSAIEKNSESKSSSAFDSDMQKTIMLGEKFVEVAGGVIDLARMEAQLAVKTFPKLMMLWLLLMPIMLLTWCSFSILAAWSVYAASEEMGLALLTLFLLQVVLLLICRWAYVVYRTRMSFPYTRAQIVGFMRSVKDELDTSDKTKK